MTTLVHQFAARCVFQLYCGTVGDHRSGCLSLRAKKPESCTLTSLRIHSAMGKKVTLAACTLNQWAMDFDGNYKRILDSVVIAKEKGAKYRLGPELEITGYGASDHFHESDTCLHSWEVLAKLLSNPRCMDIICDVGMPVIYKNVCFNCRVIFLNGEILLVRPKMFLCDDLNYRESRWFSPWTKRKTLEDLALPRMIQSIRGQKTAKFGDGVISTLDTRIGVETCEEMFTAHSPHADLSSDGVEIITNGSGSHHHLRKAEYRQDIMRSAMLKCGGVYVYSNLIGCDGERVYYDGMSTICLNGEIVVTGPRFSLLEVFVNVATVDLEDVRMYRNSLRSRSHFAATGQPFPQVTVQFALSAQSDIHVKPTVPVLVEKFSPEQEIALGPACWLWDYLRRSGQSGFFLPLSGGVDSSSTACIVASMCRLVCKAVEAGDTNVISDARRITNDQEYLPQDPNDLANRILSTCYMATENSSVATRMRAEALALDIGCYHMNVNVDRVVTAIIGVVSAFFGVFPKYRVLGGTERENLALQNVQARIRMVMAYLLAQIIPWVRGQPGCLLVLGTANVDECLRGYFTKYDCSSADINPIGCLNKRDLRRFIAYCIEQFGFTSLREIVEAPPTAELEPLVDGAVVQLDEEDMGITYEELCIYGRLRKENLCGPYSMFCKLVHIWSHMTPLVVAQKVKDFFRYYAINRHKMTVITPSYHAEKYSPDDNRFDHRQFLYNVQWPWQFRKIDEEAQVLVTALTALPREHVEMKQVQFQLQDSSVL